MTFLNTHRLTHPEGEGWANQGWGSLGSHLKEQGSSTEVTTESRREFRQLSNTGFFIRSLADKRRLGEWLIDIV